jgi:hypothetical protein
MKRVLILVEGQTEETFVRDVLNPHLHANGKTLAPTLVVTKRVKDGPNFKGGITNFAKLEGDLRRLFRDTNAAAVTTMLDYYGLPSDFPGLATRPPGTPAERVAHVETAFANHVNEPRFIPYLSLHEFEALVFASLNQAAWVFDDAQALASLQRDLQNAGSAELINENPMTAPSRRIEGAYPRYQKVLQGPMAVAAAGLQQLRTACPHFDTWISKLEQL